MEIRVRQTCQRCMGKGVFHQPGCVACGSLFGSEFNAEDRSLPCGHARVELREEWDCLDCMSTGKIESWMTVQEWIAKVQSVKASPE